jgi:fucose 4-O-acetylase-like acetyltransferase
MIDNKNIFNNFKGILSLIIIYGHIQQIVSPEVHRQLATFNVSLFLILPFLFNNDTLTMQNIFKIFKRYYSVFILFLFLTTILYTIIYSHDYTILGNFTITAIFGSNPLIKELTGTSYLWFLPTLISTIILIMTYNSIKNKKIFLSIMLVAHISITLIDQNVLYFFPFNSAISIYIFVLGIFISYLYNNYITYLNKIKYLIYLLFIIMLYDYYGTSYWYTLIKLPNLNAIYDLLLFDSIQICAFFTLLFIVKDINNKYISWIGKNSLFIYTLHPLVIFMLNYFHKWQGFLQGSLKFILTILITVVIIYIMKLTKINKIIYPR